MLCVSLKGEPGPYPKPALLLLLPCLCIPSLLLISGILGRQWRLKPISYKQETGTHTGFCAQEPHRVLLSSSLYSRMYRNMGTMIFSLFWLFLLHLFLVQRHIMCNICGILYKSTLVYLFHNASQPQLFYKENILASKSSHIKCYKMNILKSLYKSI